jgi:predicted protein tyrosine phosphatase
VPSIHVCSLSKIADTVAATGASHLLTLINATTPVPRPESVPAENHLFLGFNDITEPMEGMTHPTLEHVKEVVAFAKSWDREKPMVVHCFAGISRSTAAAYIIACVLRPDLDEAELAASIRAQSPTATPNALLIRLADEYLGRDGRMIKAIAAIGRGEDAFEGHPVCIEIIVPDA